MSRTNDDRREKELISIRLYRGDRQTLIESFPKLGYNEVIRRLIGSYCTRLREVDSQRRSQAINDMQEKINV